MMGNMEENASKETVIALDHVLHITQDLVTGDLIGAMGLEMNIEYVNELGRDAGGPQGETAAVGVEGGTGGHGVDGVRRQLSPGSMP